MQKIHISNFLKQYGKLFAIIAILMLFIPHIANAAIVKHIEDGDTVILEDGNKIRFAAIRTTEKLTKTDEPSKKLQELSLGKEIRIEYEMDPKTNQPKIDKYGRNIAEKAYIGDLWLQREMVKLGLAIVYPNRNNKEELLKELYHAEDIARREKTGIWKDFSFITAKEAQNKQDEFVMLQAEVAEVRQINKGTIASLKDSDLQLFIPNAPDKFLENGQKIEVRGWVSKYRNQPQVKIANLGQLKSL